MLTWLHHDARDPPPVKTKPGHDLHSIGAWPEHGLLGSRLGPNRNGKKW